MVDCGDVFCVQCLQDFYNNAINEGDLIAVRCLDPDCAKKREAQSPKKRRKPKTLSPSELLQIPLEHEMVTRYVKLKHKADLESDKNTIYCPRKWCQGAARSKKHRKPEGLEVVESDDESDAEDGKNKKFSAGNDLLSVCEDCSFAFCSRCYSSWHGEFTYCAPKKSTGELTEEDKASMEYLQLHTTPCPTCAAPAQKTHGCNHMICFKCNTHFCYLCSAWLAPDNPYKHYNLEKTSCYMRLWELEGGDGDDVGIGFAGGVQARVPEEPEEPEGVEVDGDILDRIRENFQDGDHLLVPLDVHDVDDPDDRDNPVPAPAPQQLQREGPLVLRINQLPPQPAPPVPDAPQAAGRVRRQGGVRGFQFGQNRVIDPRPAGIRQAALMGGRRLRGPAGRGEGRGAAAEEGMAQAREAAHQAWVERFVQMALNDEEDQMPWDSDDEEDDAAWEIPVR
jgi:E3 ubiquitin-protein ligase RNF14